MARARARVEEMSILRYFSFVKSKNNHAAADSLSGDWKTRNAGTTRISRNSITFANFITSSLFNTLRLHTDSGLLLRVLSRSRGINFVTEDIDVYS